MFYTKKGDDGKTQIFGCNQKLSKSSKVAEALGALDEINSFLGIFRTKLANQSLISDLKKGQTLVYKEIVFELSGAGVFNELQNEGGVHRVQRIPKTEKQGRVHTSTATVAVLLKPKKTEINISPADLDISTYKSSGPGGQYVNKTESAVRILHKPTGLVVTCQSERNQLSNKETAMTLLAARLLQRQEEADLSSLSAERREQIGWAKRAEKIRTYNYPQNRITDHRIDKSWHNLEAIVNGDLEPIVKSFKKYEEEKKKLEEKKKET